MNSRYDAIRRAVEHAGAIYRLDANETATFARQLEAIDVTVYTREYPQYKGTTLVPIKSDVPTGAASYTYRWFDHVGQMLPVANYADDPPRVDLLGYEETTKIYSWADSYAYSFQDLRAASMMNIALETEKAVTARDVAADRLDQIIFTGYSSLNLTGLANNANVPLVSPITGSWASATADQILADLLKLESSIFTASSGVEMADTLVLPQSSYALAQSKPLGVNEQQTVLEYFTKRALGIRNVEWSYRLELANAAGNGPRAIAFKRDPRRLQAIVPVEFESFPPEPRNFSFNINNHMRAGGVVIRYPKSVAYMDGI